MAILCTVMGHTPGTQRHHNQGLEFSLCHHCGCDLIRFADSADWTKVPTGFQVVWREFGRVDDAKSVAQRMARMTPPRRRDPRGARPASRRDPRGTPVRGTASMMGLLTRIGRLVEDEPADTLIDRVSQKPIRLPYLKN
ncbi:hypothetical protein [Sphingomonas sp. S2-65]|uniref:hypothetical protein n=1 Tax=Sphingomonas sp. S2-65 TaxID=2903960 RepID=UPI001F3D3569|nr:hypothetical protein [Sphingomonas sp. S2-65]UYY59140.1 hypothetical protein LZ586_03305 [Sphingomonas sp. S2-65]